MAETKTTTGTTASTTTTISITIELGKTKFIPQELSIPVETIATATETPIPAEATTTGALPAPEETGAIALQKMQAAHEKAVEYCVELEAEEFAELIRYAQHRNNKFPAYAVEIRDVINADDVYKDAIGRICEPLGKEVTRKAIKLVDSKKILDLAEYLKYIKTIVEEWGDI